MRRPAPDRATTMAQLLRQWPAAAAVLTRLGMACPGCAMAPFETIDDAAGAYGLTPAWLLAELRAVTGHRPCTTAKRLPDQGGAK